jgi:hypothetical protein
MPISACFSLILPLFPVLHSVPIMRTFCHAVEPPIYVGTALSSVALAHRCCKLQAARMTEVASRKRSKPSCITVSDKPLQTSQAASNNHNKGGQHAITFHPGAVHNPC